MKSSREATRLIVVLFGAVLVLVGCGAVFWAWMNLIGVPMQERSSMHPRDGWISVGIAVVALTLAVWAFKRKH